MWASTLKRGEGVNFSETMQPDIPFCDSDMEQWALADGEEVFEVSVSDHSESASSDRWEELTLPTSGDGGLRVEDFPRIDAFDFSGQSHFDWDPGYAGEALEDLPQIFFPNGLVEGGNAASDSSASKKKKLSRGGEGGERRKGIPWTEDEHKLFLQGLERFGKGDWRSISRTFVTSRTPTQVASHAQKYFIRLHSVNKDKRRSSIHDITSANIKLSTGPLLPVSAPARKSISSQGGLAVKLSGVSKARKPQAAVSTPDLSLKA